ncbi:Histone chaperone [Alternaria alternata]|nr:Histone chaperone [Alternaria alternata]
MVASESDINFLWMRCESRGSWRGYRRRRRCRRSLHGYYGCRWLVVERCKGHGVWLRGLRVVGRHALPTRRVATPRQLALGHV